MNKCRFELAQHDMGAASCCHTQNRCSDIAECHVSHARFLQHDVYTSHEVVDVSEKLHVRGGQAAGRGGLDSQRRARERSFPQKSSAEVTWLTKNTPDAGQCSARRAYHDYWEVVSFIALASRRRLAGPRPVPQASSATAIQEVFARIVTRAILCNYCRSSSSITHRS